MSTTMLGLTDIGLALLFIGISLPLILRAVPMNALYGFRIPQAFRSDEDWYAINEYGGRQMALWSLPMIATGLLKLILPWDEVHGIWVPVAIVGPLLVCTTVPLILTLLHVRRRRSGVARDGRRWVVPKWQRWVARSLVLMVIGVLAVRACLTLDVRPMDLVVVPVMAFLLLYDIVAERRQRRMG